MKKIKQIMLFMSVCCCLMYLSNVDAYGQTCVGTSISVEENDFPQTCISTAADDAAASTATFDYETGYATNGMDDIRVTMTASCSAEANDAEAKGRNYIHRGVAKRSFNLGYKIASKFALPKAEAMMENGLLGIRIPYADEAKPKVLKIK